MQPTHGSQYCNTYQILICDGYVKSRESLYTKPIIGINIISNYVDIIVVLLSMRVLVMYINLNEILKNTTKYPYPTSIKKCEFLIIDA